MGWLGDYMPAVAGGAGISAIFVAIVSAIANRKIVGARTTETLTKTATGIATSLERQLHAALRELARERAYRRDRDDLVEAHEKWDRMVVRGAERLIPPLVLPDPPPLWPDDDDAPPPPKATH